MAEYLGLSALGWQAMTKDWFHIIFAIVLIATIVLGSVFIVFFLCRKVLHWWHSRRNIVVLPAPIAQYFDHLSRYTQRFTSHEKVPEDPGSFGVFLGSFCNPPTPNQSQILSQWDMIVLDPLQPGVLDAISLQCSSPHKLGRLDVATIVQSDCPSPAEIVQALDMVVQVLVNSFKRPVDSRPSFNGILLANWQRHFPPAICNELVKYIDGRGLNVYLELAPPEFLGETVCRALNMELVKGIIYRNGTIHSNGEQRNYFEMADIRPAQRALAKVSTALLNIMWETIDDDVKLEHAVVKRSYDWCRFNTVLSWIGPRAALSDADISVAKVIKGQPLGALMWLKSDDAIEIHTKWKSNDKISQVESGDHSVYDSLDSFVPNLAAKLSLMPRRIEDQITRPATTMAGFDWPARVYNAQTKPFSYSPRGHDYTGFGCFHIGLDNSWDDFTDLVDQQRRLRDLNMLEPLRTDDLREISDRLQKLYDADSSWASSAEEPRAVKELLDHLAASIANEDVRLRIFTGLHSGFRTAVDKRFHALYDINHDTGDTDIFLSLKAVDRAGTILHAYMSSRRFTRTQCFMIEIALAEQNDCLDREWQLPSRVVQDIQQLTPTETILFMQHFGPSNSAECAVLSTRVRSCCEYQLLDAPTLSQLKTMNAGAYLRGEVSPEDLVKARITWHHERGCQHPSPTAAISVFKEINVRVSRLLLDQEDQLLSQLEKVLQIILLRDAIDASADIFALAVFCAFRGLAFNEVYMEVLDRNPLPNQHTDQAACFAEMFAVGSQCETYFDVTPTVLGKMIFNKYRSYYKNHQPPPREDGFTELPTAYASKMVDMDPDAARQETPVYYQVTFLGIFAIPALVDILLLTTLGRGLYVSNYMIQDEKTMATSGLMAALVLCGAVGTWIGSGGSYYLHCMAFAAMNMFVLTRFVAGIAICLAGGLFAFILIGILYNFYAAFIFFIYFFVLSTYLTLLATLSIYQMPGFVFQSGRIVVITCIPILLISPIVTLWAHHDIVVYICVLVVFLVSLLYGTRRVMSQWSNWYLRVPCMTDKEVADWYAKAKLPQGKASEIDLAASKLPRQALLADILAEVNRRPWTKATTDETVKKMAEGYQATKFLMDWYCKYSRTEMPFPFSPTWNLQCKASIDTLRDMQKGVKLHNAFVHWRHAGQEVWCGVLYFVVALMDKWIALFTGGSIVGLSAASSETYRLAVGFGLSYYLIGAVFLDAVAQPLWARANKKTAQSIPSLEYLKQVDINDARARSRLYWLTLTKFLFMHMWSLSASAALMWVFNSSMDATIMYFAYIGAYTGILWYQYNRIFTGPAALKDLLVSAIAGLTVGLVLHYRTTSYAYVSVTALAVASWMSSLLSLYTAKVGLPTFEKAGKDVAFHKDVPASYFSTGYGGRLSQTTLSDLFDSFGALSSDVRHKLDPTQHPGVEVLKILTDQANVHGNQLVRNAFKSAEQIRQKAANCWKNGDIVVQIIPARHLLNQQHKMRSIYRKKGNQLHIFVFISMVFVGDEWSMDISLNCRVVAEAILQATAEAKLGLPHSHSILAEVLAVQPSEKEKHVEKLAVPESIKRRLENYPAERQSTINNADKDLLRHLLLGLDCDIDWDLLPRNVRSLLLKRSLGEDVQVSVDQLSWIYSRFCKDSNIGMDEFIARCNLGATLTLLINSFAMQLEINPALRSQPEASDSSYEDFVRAAAQGIKGSRYLDFVRNPFIAVHQKIKTCIRFVVVSLVADPEFQRELDYLVSKKPWIIRWPLTITLNCVWLYTKTLQRLILPIFLFHGREKVAQLYRDMKGVKTVVKKNCIVIQSLTGSSTCFFKANSDGTSSLYQYSGIHKEEPARQHLVATNTYSNKMVLLQREEYTKEALTNLFKYEYSQYTSTTLPIERQCMKGVLEGQKVHYDQRGYITSGSYIKDGNLVQFRLSYRKNAKFDDELLRGEYIFPHITIKVNWSTPPPKNADKIDKYIPNPKVLRATFTEGSDVYKAQWSYDHKWHPTITTTLNGEERETPLMIQYDWFGVLSKPRDCSFLNENPLFTVKSVNPNYLQILLGLNTQRYRISTSRARAHLWKFWKTTKELDAVTARWLDEITMRSDSILRPYWRNRDIGRFEAAEKYLSEQADTILARVDLEPEISSWTSLAYKYADLCAFGQGGDSRINTRTQASQMKDTHNTLHVLAMDTGTWPNEGGGVSACRRDMVNDLTTIRWHILAESANDFGVPKFQIERNVQSLTVLPLWGLDFLTPTHGMFKDYLDSEVQRRSDATRKADIKEKFLPILKVLVRCSRAIEINEYHIEEASKALVDLNNYFETARHWSDVWMSDIVKQTWRELWLTEDMDNTIPVSQWLEAERPTLLHLDNALDMWQRYLFIFSVPVPDRIPDVFQASHHFAGASYGVLCKLKRACTLHVWDHCISWREVTVFLSSAMSLDSPFVCTSLISLSRLASVLILHHADVVLPCADFFNPGWEVEIGSQENTMCHRKTFARKIDPVVNGICNMESFKPIEQIKTKTPTAVMLSHVRFVKDIKNAILAADIIVNVWGFKAYQLHVYGDMERAPTYAVECQEIIAAKKLRDNVILKGLGSPSKVLQDAWLFLNSSVSEGLPLAMGEAALTGTPVVCTDVGASFRVVTDPKTGKRFSPCIAPNDAVSLARAQVNVLAMLDEWAEYADDAPGFRPKLSLNPTPEELQWVEKRMYEKQEQRRRLGGIGRSNVFNSFSSQRYLKEHEQMLWIGKFRSQSYRARTGKRVSEGQRSGSGSERTAAMGEGSGSGRGARISGTVTYPASRATSSYLTPARTPAGSVRGLNVGGREMGANGNGGGVSYPVSRASSFTLAPPVRMG